MRKIIYGGAASLDGYFASENDAVDWLLWSDELRVVMSGHDRHDPDGTQNV